MLVDTRSFDNLHRLIDWLAVVARRNGDLATRVDHLTRALVDPANYGGNGKIAESLTDLLAGVRYIVFNIPAHLAKEQERIFVAVLRPLQEAEQYAWPAADTQVHEVMEYCQVHVLAGGSSPNLSNDFTERLANEWRRVWNDYADLTTLLERNGIFTWNQFLLHGCLSPEPFGLSWTSQKQRQLSGYYLHATKKVLDTLGIRAPDPSNTYAWNNTLQNLPQQTDCWPDLPPDVVERWRVLEPRTEARDVGTSAAASIYHLIRSYARWGGGAFISIPVVIASRDSRHASAVLSVCSDLPLTSDALARWRLVATSVLPLVASSELVTHFELEHSERDAARRQAESWAHEVKNRTGPVIRFLSRASTLKGDHVADTTYALHATLILNAASFAYQLALGRQDDLRRLSRSTAPEIVEAVLQYLLNYYSASSADQFQWSRWAVNECIDVLCKVLEVPSGRSIGERAKDALTKPQVVWTIALLRELVQNIRINSSPEGAERRIDIDYRITFSGTDLVVELTQRQRELNIDWNTESARGVQLANNLFGKERGLGLGNIEVAGPEVDMSDPVGAWDGRYVVIRSRATLALEE